MNIIFVAGGSGLRMNSAIPKQFLEIWGKPLIFHTIKAFSGYCECTLPVIVLCPSQLDRWKELCEKHCFTMPHRIVAGGETRFHSVKNALATFSANETGLIAVHDAVRPLVSSATIDDCISIAKKTGCAVPVVPVVDSVREIIDSQKNRALDRASLRLVQTPQIFDLQLLKTAYSQDYREDFTDCASVFERSGHKISFAKGNVENIKITSSHDLAVARGLMQRR